MKAHVVVLVFLTLLLAGACDSGPTWPSPQPDGLSPAFTRYSLSGRVISDAGSPIANVSVQMHHGFAAGSTFTSKCPTLDLRSCWLTTQSNGTGEYAMEFVSGELRPGKLGYMFSQGTGHEANIQWVPAGSLTIVQDLILRPIHLIRAGESTSVLVDPGSSLCSDFEYQWVLDHRCALVRIEVSGPTTLVVEVRAAAGGSVVPLVFRETSGGFPWQRLGPSTISYPVHAGISRIFVGIPDGSPPQQFDVVTSLR